MTTLAEFETRFWLIVFCAACFGVVYWWRRRTQSVKLDLGESSKKLTEMVKEADKPAVADVAELAGKIMRSKR